MISSYGYAIPSSNDNANDDGNDSCENCGISSKCLKKCNQCKAVIYCSRECQVSHWKKHKSLCKYLSLPAAGQDPRNQENNVILKKALHDQSKMIRKMKKDGTPIISVSYTHAGMVGPDMPIPDGVPSNFGLKQKALTEFHSARGSRQFFGEASYKAYYEELVQNESEWMEFFKHDSNHEHAEHTCGILGTLATLLRQRGTYEECGNVLDMEEKVLGIFKEQSYAPGASMAQKNCCDSLEYLMNRIRYNLNNNLKQYRANIQVFRDLCIYEANYHLSHERQMYLFMVEVVKGDISDRRTTANDVHALSDEECLKAIILPITSCSDSPDFIREQAKGKKRTELLTCGNESCKKQEMSLGQFKSCKRCDKVVYCGKECQKKAWKAHKKICCKKK